MALIDSLHNGNRLGNGCYATVYASKQHGWVIKHARNDGTRDYLQWCMKRQAEGRGMKGMPKVDFVVDDPENPGMYIAALELLQSPCKEWGRSTERSFPDHHKFSGWHKHGFDELRNGRVYIVNMHKDCPTYLKDLILAFESECKKPANDFHSQNAMVRPSDGEIICTDPCSCGYGFQYANVLCAGEEEENGQLRLCA